MMFGLDLLGAAKYPDAAIAGFPKGFALGVFAEQFGDSRKVVKDLCATGKVAQVRVHLIWDDGHRYGPAQLNHLRDLAKMWNETAKKCKVPFELSPFCEHSIFQQVQTEPFLDAVHTFAPDCIPVNSITGSVEPSKRFVNEIHGMHSSPFPGRYNFSFDGNSCVDADVSKIAKIHRTAQSFYFWTSQFNGKARDDEKSAVGERVFWPSEELIKSVAFLATRPYRSKLPIGWTWKTHGEQHQQPPAQRELKPVMICPVKTEVIQLRTKNALIHELHYYGPFVDGRHRYYANEWGYKIANKAVLSSRYPTCEVWAEKKRIGIINPGFRCGDFH